MRSVSSPATPGGTSRPSSSTTRTSQPDSGRPKARVAICRGSALAQVGIATSVMPQPSISGKPKRASNAS